MGEIVWRNGPFPCGEWSDIRIAREALTHELEDEEKALADCGYNATRIFF